MTESTNANIIPAESLNIVPAESLNIPLLFWWLEICGKRLMAAKNHGQFCYLNVD